jgi:hypothetical protein
MADEWRHPSRKCPPRSPPAVGNPSTIIVKRRRPA